MRALVAAVLIGFSPSAVAQVAVRADLVHTMAGAPIADGVVVVTDGKIAAIGPATEVQVPDGHRELRAAVCLPGLIDARSVVGLSGWLNQEQDQGQLDRSAAMQPELRAIDAYDARDRLVQWIRELGVTTVHTGHAPGALISGQTAIFKTGPGDTVGANVVVPFAMVACSLGSAATGEEGKPPGNRSKAVAMLRQRLLDARSYAAKLDASGEGEAPGRDLALEALTAVLKREVPLLVYGHRDHDLLAALRIADEFDIRVVLDGAAEAFRVLDAIQAAKVPVIAHAPMMRSRGDAENATFRLGAILHESGIPFAYQSGYETYVPKTRCVLWEAAVGAAHDLGADAALRAITIDAAKLLGIADRVGSLEVGKDGDVALYDGDPFEYTTHCVGVVIDGVVVSEAVR